MELHDLTSSVMLFLRQPLVFSVGAFRCPPAYHSRGDAENTSNSEFKPSCVETPALSVTVRGQRRQSTGSAHAGKQRSLSRLAARGESPAAFGRRCIPPGCVAPSSD